MRVVLRTAVLVAAVACDREPAPAAWSSPVPFDSAFVVVRDSTRAERLLVEVARTEPQRSFGLMQRPTLPDSAGMIFLYDTIQPPTSGFWMFQTNVPLDIAFFDTAGVVLAVLQMDPCPSPYPDVCRSYAPGVPYTGALEVNRGWFERRSLGIGARVELSEQ